MTSRALGARAPPPVRIAFFLGGWRESIDFLQALEAKGRRRGLCSQKAKKGLGKRGGYGALSGAAANSPAPPSVVVEGAKKYYFLGGETVRAVVALTWPSKRANTSRSWYPPHVAKTTVVGSWPTKPTEGTVFIDRTDISKLDASDTAWPRCRKIGYIFQTFNLIPIHAGPAEGHAAFDLRRR